jgi:hypothetical protein
MCVLKVNILLLRYSEIVRVVPMTTLQHAQLWVKNCSLVYSYTALFLIFGHSESQKTEYSKTAFKAGEDLLFSEIVLVVTVEEIFISVDCIH